MWLWNGIEDIGQKQNGPWSIMGDFNNVLGIQDRIGGKHVQDYEFVDLRKIMENARLFEVESGGDKYTRFNNHTEGPIYSRIDSYWEP